MLESMLKKRPTSFILNTTCHIQIVIKYTFHNIENTIYSYGRIMTSL